MTRARVPRPSLSVGLALFCALGSVACGRPSPSGATRGQIDITSPGAPSWPGFEAAAEPELTDADVEKIAVKVPPERVPAVTAKNPAKGPATAPVTLQVFSDFQCPFCVRAAPTLADVEQRYHGKLRLVWRNYPLPGHERARPAARAALSAFEQGGSERFWQLHDLFFSPQGDLSDTGLRRAAEKLSLDVARFERAVQTPGYDALIDADMAAGDAAGIEGTPAVFINDWYLMGARFESEYAVVVERALREAAR
jgi:protein-disulfide isomerase